MNQKIRLVTQQNKWYCGPASVKMVLDSYGLNFSQDELGRLMGVTSDGCDLPQIVDGMIKIGLRTTYKKNSSLEEVKNLLNQGVSPLLYWDRHGRIGHWSVFSNVDGKRVYIADPGNSYRITSFTKERFLERWRDPENPLDRREIVIIKRG